MNAPPSYHIDRLREIGDGEIFKVITAGKGQMGRYGDRIERSDRWAVVAYVRALQRAHRATTDDVPPHIRQAHIRQSQAQPASAPDADSDRADRLSAKEAVTPETTP
jgi:hypothetical protein